MSQQDAETGPPGKALNEAQLGVIFAGSAYLLWGLTAAFYKLLAHVGPLELVAHRAIWSVPTAAILLFFMGRTGDIPRAFKTPRVLLVLALTSILISINWGIYVWAIASARALEVSLGYFINPLVSVGLGFVLLGERMLPGQWVAIAVAAVAVVVQTVLVGVVPWISLSVSFTFALYGYFRKTVDIGPAQGFLVEALLLSLPAIAYAGWLGFSGNGMFAGTPWDTFLLVAAGPVTALPLILFSAGAKRLRLSTIGLMQYIAPSLIFLTAVFLFREKIDGWRLFSFCLIWLALVIFSVSSFRAERASRRNARLAAGV